MTLTWEKLTERQQKHDKMIFWYDKIPHYLSIISLKIITLFILLLPLLQLLIIMLRSGSLLYFFFHITLSIFNLSDIGLSGLPLNKQPCNISTVLQFTFKSRSVMVGTVSTGKGTMVINLLGRKISRVLPWILLIWWEISYICISMIMPSKTPPFQKL